jgi:hypothetical protein
MPDEHEIPIASKTWLKPITGSRKFVEKRYWAYTY